MFLLASLVAQTVKSLPAMQETRVQSLGQKDTLEKKIATHSQYSCLENSMDRGAWRAIVHGFAKEWTRLSGDTFSLSRRASAWLDEGLERVGVMSLGNLGCHHLSLRPLWAYVVTL